MNKTPPPAFRNLGLAMLVLRQLNGKTLEELARLAGFGKSQLSRYEKGKDLPKLESLAKLLEVWGMPPLDFFKVLEMLDTMRAGTNREELRVVKGLLPEGMFRAMITSDTQELICGVIKDSAGTFEAQLILRRNGRKP